MNPFDNIPRKYKITAIVVVAILIITTVIILIFVHPTNEPSTPPPDSQFDQSLTIELSDEEVETLVALAKEGLSAFLTQHLDEPPEERQARLLSFFATDSPILSTTPTFVFTTNAFSFRDSRVDSLYADISSIEKTIATFNIRATTTSIGTNVANNTTTDLYLVTLKKASNTWKISNLSSTNPLITPLSQ